MFGTSGIRGPVGETVTADLALSVGRALAVDAERVVVGRDPRESGQFLADALAAGLRESGTGVVRLGLASTPTIARAVAWQGADAGVSVTASHNPPEDNGIKLWQPSGQAFDGPLREAITARIESGAFEPASWDAVGRSSHWNARKRHVEAIVDAVSPDPELSVVVDVGNGAGGLTADALVELGCDAQTLNAQPDGVFPGRPSEPTLEHCSTLRAMVADSDADLGIAHDGDADRMQAVAGDGTWVGGDRLLALFARDAVGSGDRVAAPVDTSLAVDDALDDVGASVTRTKVGDVYVAERASEPDVVFGGEPSGAWIWPEETLCPDGPLAAAKLVELAAERPLADRASEVPSYPIRRDSLETDEKGAVMDRVRERVTDEFEAVSTLDGLRVDLDDGWFLVRASGTQPLIRLTAEAREAERASALYERARDLVQAAME